jgi:signal peptidase II
MNKKSEICKSPIKICQILILLIVLTLDQLSKIYVLKITDASEQTVIKLTSFLNIVLTWNRGVTFGMFNDLTYGKMIFTIFAIILTIILSIWMFKSKDKLEVSAIAMIIGGALGNIIDRIRFGAVVDFIDFYIYSYHWYVFNIADSAICLGVMILLYINIMFNVRGENK